MSAQPREPSEEAVERTAIGLFDGAAFLWPQVRTEVATALREKARALLRAAYAIDMPREARQPDAEPRGWYCPTCGPNSKCG